MFSTVPRTRDEKNGYLHLSHLTIDDEIDIVRTFPRLRGKGQTSVDNARVIQLRNYVTLIDREILSFFFLSRSEIEQIGKIFARCH